MMFMTSARLWKQRMLTYFTVQLTCLICLDSAALLMLNEQQLYLFGQIQTSPSEGQSYSETVPYVSVLCLRQPVILNVTIPIFYLCYKFTHALVLTIKLQTKDSVLLGAAAIALWLCLHLPSCSAGFESHAHHLRFYQFVLLKLE